MASVFTRVPIDRITATARDIRPVRSVLILVAGVLFLLGWLVAKVCAAAWGVVAWCAAAVAVGWQEARRASGSDE